MEDLLWIPRQENYMQLSNGTDIKAEFVEKQNEKAGSTNAEWVSCEQ